jgi:hypothetical protein
MPKKHANVSPAAPADRMGGSVSEAGHGEVGSCASLHSGYAEAVALLDPRSSTAPSPSSQCSQRSPSSSQRFGVQFTVPNFVPFLHQNWCHSILLQGFSPGAENPSATMVFVLLSGTERYL